MDEAIVRRGVEVIGRVVRDCYDRGRK
jgi:hypothetical protein